MAELTYCPFCEKETIEIITKPNKTRFCKCSNCEEEFVPGGMMNENLKILRETGSVITEKGWTVNKNEIYRIKR